MSSCGEDTDTIGGEELVFLLRNNKAVGMHADITAALKLALEDNSLVHVLAESRTGNVAVEEDGSVGRLVCPLVEEVG